MNAHINDAICVRKVHDGDSMVFAVSQDVTKHHEFLVANNVPRVW